LTSNPVTNSFSKLSILSDQSSISSTTTAVPAHRKLVNPLATKFVAPGKLPWICGHEDSIEQLIARLHGFGLSAQIVGPHGTGKTTLLEHLLPKLSMPIWQIGTAGTHSSLAQTIAANLSGSNSHQVILWLTLRRNSPVMRLVVDLLQLNDFRGILVIDGAEQLGWWQWLRVRRWVKKRHCGLLVTTHRNLGLSTLYQTSVSCSLAEALLKIAFDKALLEAGAVPPFPEEIDWQSLFQRHQSNLRECFMDIFDEVEIAIRKMREHVS
jgi:hypothetical protein